MILRSFIRIDDRLRWDKSIASLKILGGVNSSNMILLHQVNEEFMDGGYKERELLLKRFIFRKNGRLFVYQSSVPDDIHETPDVEKTRGVVRYTQVMEMWCFEIVGRDVILTLISQIHLRKSQSQSAIQYYINGMHDRCKKWHENLSQYIRSN